MLAVKSGKWQEGGIAMNEGQQQELFYLSGDHNLTTHRHTHKGTWVSPTFCWRHRLKWQNISKWMWQTVAYLYQTRPIVKGKQKSRGWPGPFVIDSYTSVSSSRPFHQHLTPCQLLISRTVALGPPASLGSVEDKWAHHLSRTCA